MNESLKKKKPREHSALTQMHFDIKKTLCNKLIVVCPLAVTKSSFMRMSDHLFKSFLGLFVQWGKKKILHHILKRHGFGVKVLQIGYGKKKDNVKRS